MNKKRLEEIKNNPEPTIKDLVEIASESFTSQSKHFNDIKSILRDIETTLITILQELEKVTHPMFQIIEEEEED